MGQRKDGKAGKEEMAGLIGGHCPQRPSLVAEGSHGNRGAGQGSLQSQSTTAQRLTGKGVTAREKQLLEGPEQALPYRAGKRHSCASWNPSAEPPLSCVLPLHDAKTVSVFSCHALQGGVT